MLNLEPFKEAKITLRFALADDIPSSLGMCPTCPGQPWCAGVRSCVPGPGAGKSTPVSCMRSALFGFFCVSMENLALPLWVFRERRGWTVLFFFPFSAALFEAVANKAVGSVLQTVAACSEQGSILMSSQSSYQANSTQSVKRFCPVETHHSLSLGQNLKIHTEVGSWCLAPSLSSKLISLGLNPGVFEVCGRGPTGVCESQALAFPISWALEMIQLEGMAAIPPFGAQASPLLC